MDLKSEASTGASGRVVAARHVTAEADKAFPHVDNAINTTLLCHSTDPLPDFKTYSTALQVYGPILWFCGAAVVLVTCFLYLLSLKATRRHRPAAFTNAVFVLAVYPIVAISAYIAALVPRARLIAEAVAQQAVMMAMYQLFCLFLTECGGTDQLVRRANGARLETRVLPCCCWPCCVIPRPEIQKKNLAVVRYLVLQMPIIQAILYVISLVLWEEDKILYQSSFLIIQPFVAASILIGVWGVIISVRAADSAGVAVKAKFLAVQIVLLIVKLQCGFAKVLPELITLPCLLPLHPTVFVNLLHNSAMMLEMLLLSIWAWRLYSTPVQKAVDKVPQVVSVISAVTDNLSVDAINYRDGLHNKSFIN